MESKIGAVPIENPQEQHCALVLLVDNSGSMDGQKIQSVREGLNYFKDEIKDDEQSKVDVAIVTFGESVKVQQDFMPIASYVPLELKAEGRTPMGEAITTAIDMIEKRKSEYKNKGVSYYRPWIFLLTDGAPTDMTPGDQKWNEIVQKVHDGEKKSHFSFFAVGVGISNQELDILRQISSPTRPPLLLKSGMFKEMFCWLGNSMSRVSQSKSGEQVKLEKVNFAEPWGNVTA